MSDQIVAAHGTLLAADGTSTNFTIHNIHQPDFMQWAVRRRQSRTIGAVAQVLTWDGAILDDLENAVRTLRAAVDGDSNDDEIDAAHRLADLVDQLLNGDIQRD